MCFGSSLLHRKNGKLEAILTQKDLQLNTQAKELDFILKDIEIMQKQIFQWQSFRESVENRLKGVDVRVLPDSSLSELFKDPTIIVEVTDPYSTKLDQGKKPK